MWQGGCEWSGRRLGVHSFCSLIRLKDTLFVRLRIVFMLKLVTDSNSCAYAASIHI